MMEVAPTHHCIIKSEPIHAAKLCESTAVYLSPFQEFFPNLSCTMSKYSPTWETAVWSKRRAMDFHEILSTLSLLFDYH